MRSCCFIEIIWLCFSKRRALSNYNTAVYVSVNRCHFCLGFSKFKLLTMITNEDRWFTGWLNNFKALRPDEWPSRRSWFLNGMLKMRKGQDGRVTSSVKNQWTRFNLMSRLQPAFAKIQWPNLAVHVRWYIATCSLCLFYCWDWNAPAERGRRASRQRTNGSVAINILNFNDDFVIDFSWLCIQVK